MKNPLRKKKYTKAQLRNCAEAYTFMAPFIIGVAIFLAFPLFISLKLSFGTVIAVKGFKIEWSGLEHYINAFVMDTNFIPRFLLVLRDTLTRVPLIMIFSLILAILLNQDIKYRGFFRVVMFLPFLLGSGYIMTLLKTEGITTSALSLTDSPLFPTAFLNYMGASVQKLINGFFEVIVSVLWASGVQILLFLSGLQGIPRSLYESAHVDGATGIEVFFKITVPMMMPIIALNMIYTIVNQFTSADNLILEYIEQVGFWNYQWENASAFAWIYFSFIMCLIGLILFIMRKTGQNSFGGEE